MISFALFGLKQTDFGRRLALSMNPSSAKCYSCAELHELGIESSGWGGGQHV
jgi:hypothetical protein